MILRHYQIKLIDDVIAAWDTGAQGVMLQLPTGGGKTIVIASIIQRLNVPTVAIAHRSELVSQLSITLARHEIRHDILAAKQTIKNIITLQMQELGRSYYTPGAQTMVAGIDTLIKLQDARFAQVRLMVHDEGHHVLRENKWGEAAKMFPNSCALYPTATPKRADGKGLGRHADGLADVLITGPTMRELIDAGWLCDYKIYAPATTDLDLSSVPLSAGGDYSPQKLAQAVHKSKIVGDVVAHYLRIAPGKLGITFATDVASATEIAEEYRAAGVPAEVITGKTPELLRAHIMRQFRAHKILQLVNVDLLGEGVDVPAVEVVSFARPTRSLAVYLQQFGRALRPAPGKTHAIIIDHVDNLGAHDPARGHGLPDKYRVWSLDRRGKRAISGSCGIPLKTCGNPRCFRVFERTHRSCPYCGHYTPPVARASPEQVDGDLIELAPDVLAAMRGEVARVDGDAHPPGHLDKIAQRAIRNRHAERQDAQQLLRAAIALWAGYYRDAGKTDSEIYRLFYFTYGVDILSAQALNIAPASELREKIKNNLNQLGVENEINY